MHCFDVLDTYLKCPSSVFISAHLFSEASDFTCCVAVLMEDKIRFITEANVLSIFVYISRVIPLRLYVK
jgi:hypothetical protein